MSLSSLVFSSQLPAPSVVSNYDLSSYNGFTKRFVQVESKGELFYIDTKNGYSVWESPSLILTILLANKIERDAFEPVRWFSVWNTPLIVLLDHHNRKWTMNKINHRMIEGIPMEIIDHIDERVRVELKMLENKPQRDLIDNELDRKTDEGREKPGESPNLFLSLEKTLRPIGTLERIEDVRKEFKEDFWLFLKEHSMPLLGDHSKLIEGLREKSNDVRMKRLSNGLQDQLIEEYLEEQRKNVQEKARDHRESLQTQIKVMIKSWQNLYQSNQKFRNNYSLFKEKYKNDKTFKEANKYFEIEKLFKGETENKQIGAISRNFYLNKVTKKNLIENFIELMRTEGVRRSSLFTDVESHKVLMDFSGLQKEDKRKIFEEFKDSL